MKATRVLAVVLILCALFPWYPPTSRMAAQGQMSTVWSAVYTDEQARRGGELYNQNCASCHMVDLSGEEYAPPLVAEYFLYRWAGKTVEDLFLQTTTTMPWDKPGALSKEAYAEILSYILKVNGFPAGRTPLGKNPVVLRQISISRKP